MLETLKHRQSPEFAVVSTESLKKDEIEVLCSGVHDWCVKFMLLEFYLGCDYSMELIDLRGDRPKIVELI